MGNREWETGNREQETGNRGRETGNGKQETGNRWHGSSKSGDFVARTEQKNDFTVSRFHKTTKQQNNKITK